MSDKFIGSGRQREGGFAAVHRHDFTSHVEGSNWFHTADQINMDPAIATLAGVFSDTTVQGTLEKLATYFSTIGQGFISIGDGYDQGDYNVSDPSTPSLKAAFDAAFTNTRLQNGGIILIKAGTYVLDSTVILPPGIMVIGENRGTIIISHTSEQPMFQIQAGTESPKMGDVLGTEQFIGRPINGNKFFNLTLADNLDGYIKSAGVPIPTMQTVPMIRCAGGSVLELDQITFMGKIQEGFPVNQRPPITRSVVGYNSTSAGIGSTLIVERCFIDGFGVGIEFGPAQGELDFLTVDKCRARTYGRTDVNVTATNNCFIAMSMCNATITNNYHVSTGVSATGNPENFIAQIGTYTPGSIRARIIVTGNSGGPSNGKHNNASTNMVFRLMRGFDGEHIGAVSANSWGNHIGSEWYITISTPAATTDEHGNSYDNELEGDLVGTKALEFALNHLDDTGTTLILNPGRHLVETLPASITQFKLIGNKRGAFYPIVDLSYSGFTPTVFTYPVLYLGNYLKDIIFDATNAASNVIVRVHWSNPSSSPLRGALDVENCIFRDVSLLGVDCSTTIGDEISINVRGCIFDQTGTFDDSFSMLLPNANLVRLQDCVFKNTVGYAGGIGAWATGYTGTPDEIQIIVDNCSFDLTGGTIRIASPLGADRYFVVYSQGEAVISNTKVLASNAQGVGGLPTPIDAAIDTSFLAFIDINVRSLRINNCEFNGPNQTFDSGGTDYALPTLLVTIPLAGPGFWMTNSVISGGSLPLQIKNSASYTNSNGLPSNNIYIDNCEIKTWQDGNSNTALDIDVINGADSILDAPTPNITLKNSQFTSLSSGTPATVKHANHTGAYYDVGGVVQIYANGWAVHVTDTKVFGNLNTTGIGGGLMEHWAGLLIDTHNDPSVLGADNSRIFVSNCEIDGYNTNGFGTSISAAMWLVSWHMQVTNNFIGMYNQDTGGTNDVVCLYIENRPSSAKRHGLISGNAFERFSTSLRGGYVIIDSFSAASGLLVDNKFSDITFNGSSTALVDDNTSAPFWTIERNINQTATVAVTSLTGIQKIDQTGLGYTGTSHDFRPDELTGNQVYRVQISGGAAQSLWGVDLGSVLPINTRVISATSTLSFSGTGTPSGSVTLSIRNVTSSDSAAGTVPGGGAITVTAATSENYIINSTQRPRIYVDYALSETGGSAFYDAVLTPIVVTYRW